AIQNKSVRGESERFPVECSTTQVIGVEAQQEVMAALGAKRKAARRGAVHGDQRLDRGEAVATGLYPALVVGGDEALSPGRSVGADRIEPISLRPEAAQQLVAELPPDRAGRSAHSGLNDLVGHRRLGRFARLAGGLLLLEPLPLQVDSLLLELSAGVGLGLLGIEPGLFSSLLLTVRL